MLLKCEACLLSCVSMPLVYEGTIICYVHKLLNWCEIQTVTIIVNCIWTSKLSD